MTWGKGVRGGGAGAGACFNLFGDGATGGVGVHLQLRALGHVNTEEAGRHCDEGHCAAHDESDLPAAHEAEQEAQDEHGGVHGAGAELVPDCGLNLADFFVHSRGNFSGRDTVEPATQREMTHELGAARAVGHTMRSPCR